MIIAQHEHILVEFGRILLIQRQQVVLRLDLTLRLQLLPQLLLFSTWSPDWGRVVIRVLVCSVHPLETSQLLVGVHLIVIFGFLVFLLFLFALSLPSNDAFRESTIASTLC